MSCKENKWVNYLPPLGLPTTWELLYNQISAHTIAKLHEYAGLINHAEKYIYLFFPCDKIKFNKLFSNLRLRVSNHVSISKIMNMPKQISMNKKIISVVFPSDNVDFSLLEKINNLKIKFNILFSYNLLAILYISEKIEFNKLFSKIQERVKIMYQYKNYGIWWKN